MIVLVLAADLLLRIVVVPVQQQQIKNTGVGAGGKIAIMLRLSSL